MHTDGPTLAQVKTWVHLYGQAWINRDTEAATALFSADATYREDALHPPICSTTAIAKY